MSLPVGSTPPLAEMRAALASAWAVALSSKHGQRCPVISVGCLKKAFILVGSKPLISTRGIGRASLPLLFFFLR